MSTDEQNMSKQEENLHSLNPDEQAHQIGEKTAPEKPVEDEKLEESVKEVTNPNLAPSNPEKVENLSIFFWVSLPFLQINLQKIVLMRILLLKSSMNSWPKNIS